MARINTFLTLGIFLLLGCNSRSDNSNLSGNGVSGSFSRFEIAGNALYTFDDQFMTVLNISDPTQPNEVMKQRTMASAESTRKRDSVLFVASSLGLEIYDISTPLKPVEISAISHITACDPIALKDSTAYLTLRSGDDMSPCQRSVNQLDILNITDINRPRIVKSIPLTHPKGVGVQDSLLWICDDGLKVFSIKDPRSPVMIDHFKGIDAIDIIALDDLLIVSGEFNIRQYRYVNGQLSHLSTL